MEYLGSRNPNSRATAFPQLQLQPWIEARINKGMITMLDAADIDTGALQLAKNTVVRFDKTSRRPGYELFSVEKPDSDPVLLFETFKKADGTTFTIRYTRNGLQEYDGSGWVPYTGVLTGSDIDRFQTAIVGDNYVFSNNGADPIQLVDPVAQTFAQLGNASNFRYITGFANRIVGAAIKDTDETLIGWSGEGNYDEWSALVDETAGSTPLRESPADLNDWIKGIFAFTNVMIVMRERSVWIGSRSGIPQNPFNFYSAVPGIGSDCPFSICMIGDGLAWLDTRTKTVYAYSPNGSLEPIGRPIERTLLDAVDNPESIFSSYDPVENEYAIHIPLVGGGVRSWTYNRRDTAWTYDERDDATFVGDTELGTGFTSIDELGTKTIDSLGTVTINDLSPSNTSASIHVIGRADGEIGIVSDNIDIDGDVEYTTDIISKVFNVPQSMVMIAELKIEFVFRLGGSVQFWYSKTGGQGIDPWILHKTYKATELNKPILLRLKKAIRCRRFAWRVTSTSGIWDIINYELYAYPSGDARQ